MAKERRTSFMKVPLKENSSEKSKFKTTVKSQVEARVTIQKIKSWGVLQTETCH